MSPPRCAALLLSGAIACVSGTELVESTYAPCGSDDDCKDGRSCRDGACQYLDGTGGTAPGSDVTRVVFRLALDADAPSSIYIEEASPERENSWLSVVSLATTSAISTRIVPPCQFCFCGSCATCGGTCGPGRPVVKRLDPGQAVDVRWDGATFPIDSCPDSTPCYRIVPSHDGETIEAIFCWSRSATGEGPDQALLRPLSCVSRVFSFRASQAQLVDYRVTLGEG